MKRQLLILSLLLIPILAMAQDTIRFKKPFRARSLAGRITDHNGTGLPGVLVEIIDRDERSVYDKTETNKEGAFRFADMSKRKYYLRLTKFGWSPTYVTIVIDRKAKAEFELTMAVAR